MRAVVHVLPWGDDLIADREQPGQIIQAAGAHQMSDLRHGAVNFAALALCQHGQITILTVQRIFDQQARFVEHNRIVGDGTHIGITPFQLLRKFFRPGA